MAALVSRRLRELRSERGWNQVRLATEAKVGRATVATIEAGHDVPSLRTIEALAAALDVPAASLFLDPSRRARDATAHAALTGSESLAQRLAALVRSER